MRDKVVLVVIAHPDDEAFGTSGTIAKLAKKNRVHLVCVTDGGSDERFTSFQGDLSSVRAEELKRSASILGVSSVHFLGYKDGSLCNNFYHEIADKIAQLSKELGVSVLLTNEFRGISGHLDHVAVSMIANYVYEQVTHIDTILMNCISRENRALIEKYFIYFPPGYERSDVNLVVNIEDEISQKIEAIKCHQSQSGDVERILSRLPSLPKEDLFLVRSKLPDPVVV